MQSWGQIIVNMRDRALECINTLLSPPFPPELINASPLPLPRMDRTVQSTKEERGQRTKTEVYESECNDNNNNNNKV